MVVLGGNSLLFLRGLLRCSGDTFDDLGVRVDEATLKTALDARDETEKKFYDYLLYFYHKNRMQDIIQP